jgi:NAD+ kinase
MSTATASNGARRVLVMAHPGRASAVLAAAELVTGLAAAGLTPFMLPAESAQLPGPAAEVVAGADPDDPLDGAQLVVVLGGDGTILRAAEVVRGSAVPLLGVNLGHVGFLAEAERDDIAETVQRIAASQYEVEERMALDVMVVRGGEPVERLWALNEASVEKSSREKMLEVMLEVDGRPLTSFGCDGVVLATPTGSTAYAFSAGGPVVWPEVEALLLVPISAHALFSRPLVVAPSCVLAVELLERTPGGGVLWCDGRRSVPLQAGDRVEVRRSQVPIRLARLARPPFTDRLVGKFGLPVHGWRGPQAESSTEESFVPVSTTPGTPGRS